MSSSTPSTTNCTADAHADGCSSGVDLWKALELYAAFCIVVIIVDQLYKCAKRRFCPPPPPPVDDNNNNNSNNTVVIEVTPAARAAAAAGGIRNHAAAVDVIPAPARGLANTVTVFKKHGEEGDEEQGGRGRRRVERECSICLEEFEDGDECSSLDVCGHLFHKSCFELWHARNRHCPLCRASVH